MKILNFKQREHAIKKASFDLQFEQWGLTIRDCSLLLGKNGLFVTYPARSYDDNGQKKYYNYVLFTKDQNLKITQQVVEYYNNEIQSQNSFI